MGISNLINVLSPWAITGSLTNEKIVIDGPAFAYHILSLCRGNGVHQPSNRLLGRVAVDWLVELERSGAKMSVSFFP